MLLIFLGFEILSRQMLFPILNSKLFNFFSLIFPGQQTAWLLSCQEVLDIHLGKK